MTEQKNQLASRFAAFAVLWHRDLCIAGCNLDGDGMRWHAMACDAMMHGGDLGLRRTA